MERRLDVRCDDKAGMEYIWSIGESYQFLFSSVDHFTLE